MREINPKVKIVHIFPYLQNLRTVHPLPTYISADENDAIAHEN